MDPRIVGAVGVGIILASGASAERAANMDLPSDLAGYRQWPQLLKVPYAVPMALWIRCLAPTPRDWEAARQKYGPHTERFIRLYGNATAVESVSKVPREAFAVGSILVKEKLPTSPHASPDGVAFMVKRAAPAFPASNGWEFLYFPSADRRQTHEACASCHGAAAAKDYVFGEYPR